MKFKFNIPNKITLIRIALVPLFALILVVDLPNKYFLGGFVFILLSISDFLDGYFARKKNEVTEFGKLIAPIADKILISTALIILIGRGVELWMAMTIILREFILTGVRIYLVPSKIIVSSSNFGKAKTLTQSIAIAFTLFGLPFSSLLLHAAVVLTLVSGVEYLIKIRRSTGNRVVNIPNIITISRFILTIPFIYYILKEEKTITLVIFGVITLSDKLDGTSARIMNQKTELGSGLDSFTDWTLIISTFTVFVFQGYIDIKWIALLIVPAIISFLVKVVYAKRQKIVPVTFIARLNVVLAYMTIVSVLIKFVHTDVLLFATILLSYVSMAVYVAKMVGISKKSPYKKKDY